jgi:hypothetical protein
MQKCQASGSIRIIFNRGDPGRDISLVTLEIHNAYLPFVTTTTVPYRHSTIGIAATVLSAFNDQRTFWCGFRNLLECVACSAAHSR